MVSRSHSAPVELPGELADPLLVSRHVAWADREAHGNAALQRAADRYGVVAHRQPAVLQHRRGAGCALDAADDVGGDDDPW